MRLAPSGAFPVASEKLSNPEWGPEDYDGTTLRFARADLKILDLLPEECAWCSAAPYRMFFLQISQSNYILQICNSFVYSVCVS